MPGSSESGYGRCAGSACAELLGQWALRQGAVAVQGIYRSASRVERLLSGQNVRSGPGVVAAYRRFHLRDALAQMSAATWQQQFAGLWPMLMRLELPPVEMFPLADWRSALAHAGRPGAGKALLRFG